MKNILIVIVIFSLFFILSNNIVLASTTADKRDEIKSTDVIKLENPLGTTTNDPQTLIGKVINGVLGIVGSLALAMFVYGGFTWMLSAGNAEAVSKGKNILLWASVGLVVIFLSYALVNFVLYDVINAPKK